MEWNFFWKFFGIGWELVGCGMLKIYGRDEANERDGGYGEKREYIKNGSASGILHLRSRLRGGLTEIFLDDTHLLGS